jgi:hypothetical protein
MAIIHRFGAHLGGNAVAYLAIFVALGGSSYAAVQLAAGSVNSAALAKGAVTHAKLASNSVTSANVSDGSLTPSDFVAGTFLQGIKGDAGATGAQGLEGLDGIVGSKGDIGAQGAQGPRGRDGSASIAVQARLANSVTAPHGATTAVPLASATWTQSAGQLDLIAGTITLTVPSSCTGTFSNSLVISVDGQATTLAAAPTFPAGTSATLPVVIGSLSEPDSDTPHTMTAALANGCTKSGEDYAVNGAKLDVIAVG